jgi:hypothetical protein
MPFRSFYDRFPKNIASGTCVRKNTGYAAENQRQLVCRKRRAAYCFGVKPQIGRATLPLQGNST